MGGIFCLLTIQLFVVFLNTDKVQAGIANETSDPIVLRIGVDLKEFNNETILRAAAQTSIQDCLCQCHWQTFRDRYGRTHGNCKSTDQTGGRWCYVRTPVKTYLGNHGHIKLAQPLISPQMSVATCYKVIILTIIMV